MDIELNRAREKMEREQRERKERAKRKLEKEKPSKLEAARQRDAIEHANRFRRLDAAQAQAKADLQMEESLLVGRGVMFYPILEALYFQGSGDKIILPPSSFTQLSEQGAFDKGPLHFCVSVIQQEIPSENTDTETLHTRTTHAGVLQFMAEEGTVGLPPRIWNNLFPLEATESSMVEVRYVWLPKGTNAKLQVDEPGFNDIPNHKAVLETSFLEHATLSENDVLTVSYGFLRYNLRVLELKPSPSVSVLETDLEVDIIGTDMDAAATDQLVLRQLTFDKPESGEVAVGNYVYYKFSIDEATWGRVSSGDVKIEVKALEQDGDTDLYVSRHPLLFPTRHHHGWSSHDVGTKTLVLSSKDHSMGPGSYSIAVYGFKGTTRYELSVIVQENVKKSMGQQAVSSASSLEQDTVECRNCRHYIPSRSIALHEAYCIRNNIVCQYAGCGVVLRSEEAGNHVHCEICGRAFEKGEIEIEKHMEISHEPLHCACGIVFEQEQIVQHQSSECPMRLITCRFCGDVVQAGNFPDDMRDRMRGLSEHESLCGSGTAPCDYCGGVVMLKDMDIHQISVHQKS